MSDDVLDAIGQQDEAQVSPLELLLHVSLPLIPILAIAVVILDTTHRTAIEDLGETMEEFGHSKISELVITVQRQRLIRRCDKVLDQYEQDMRLTVFPKEDDVSKLRAKLDVDQKGVPRHPDFQTLCEEARRTFKKKEVDELVERVYCEVLKADIPGETTMYDKTFRPPSPGVDKRWIVNDENRGHAFDEISGRLTTFRDRIEELQMIAAKAVLAQVLQDDANFKAGGGTVVGNSQENVFMNMRSAFAENEMPLLDYLFQEK